MTQTLDTRVQGVCYNREHSWPKSWWGGLDADSPANTDIVHLFLTDRYCPPRLPTLWSFLMHVITIDAAPFESTVLARKPLACRIPSVTQPTLCAPALAQLRQQTAREPAVGQRFRRLFYVVQRREDWRVCRLRR
jgi:hypothetical protein